MRCTPSDYIILSLRKSKFYEGRGPDNPKTQKELIQSPLPISIDKILLF